MDRNSKRKIIVLALLTGFIALFHYLTPTEPHDYHKIHIVLRKLYFLPPVMAAAWFGLRGACHCLGSQPPLHHACVFGLARQLYGAGKSGGRTGGILGGRGHSRLAI